MGVWCGCLRSVQGLQVRSKHFSFPLTDARLFFIITVLRQNFLEGPGVLPSPLYGALRSNDETDEPT